MINSSPITPPKELLEQLSTKYIETPMSFADLVNEAARWGADQELEACCTWLSDHGYIAADPELRAARRPKPPSLKEQALRLLNDSISDLQDHEVATIRRALEQLND
jgi:hypothetical protein